MCVSGVVRERLDERGATVYTKAKTFPIHGDNRHGTDSFNAKLDKMAAEERRLVEVEEAASRERYENTAAYRERVEVEALIDRRVAELLAAERDKLTADVAGAVVDAVQTSLETPAKKRLLDALRARGILAAA